MKDLIVTINANTRKAMLSKGFLGITGEHLQNNIIVDFSDEFIDGTAYLEADDGSEKYLIGMTKVDEHYILPIRSSLLATVGKLACQIRVNKAVDVNTMAVFKSEVFEIPVLEAVNATTTIPEDYPTWVEEADLKLLEVDQAIARVDDAIEEMQGTFANPNLLINGDFRINQRGLTAYTGSTYTVDRWRAVQDDTIVTKTDTGVSVSFSTRIAWFRQHIENYEVFKGKTLTLSAKISNYVNGRAGKTVLQMDDGVSEMRTTISDGIISVTGQISTNATRLMVGFFNYAQGTGTDTFDVEWVKLEVGSVATAYSPRPYADEFAMCQRYFQKFRINGLVSIATSTSTLYTGLPLPVTLRTAPTITNVSQTSMRQIGAGIKGSVDVAYSALYDNILQLQAGVSSLNISSNAGVVWANGEITADAEIY